MARTEKIITKGQEDGLIRSDLRPRYLTYFFLGSLEALISTMVLENQPLKDSEHKNRLTRAGYDHVFRRGPCLDRAERHLQGKVFIRFFNL